MKEPVVKDFAALIGIDWANQKHDVCEIPLNSKKPKYSVISSKPQAIYEWAINFKKKYPNQKIAVACELKKGPLIYALEKHSHLVIFPINPSTVAKYRKAFTQSGAKDDPSDALIQAEILERHMDKLNPIFPEDCDIRALQQLVENRRKLIQNRVDLTNLITATLKNYYPQVLDWFNEKDTAIFCNFISKWPSLADAKKAPACVKTVVQFLLRIVHKYSQINEYVSL